MNNFSTCYLETFEVIALSNIKDKAVMDGWTVGWTNVYNIFEKLYLKKTLIFDSADSCGYMNSF